MLDMFKKLGGSTGSRGGGNYFTDGKYRVRLEKISAANSQQGIGEYVAVESTVLEVLVAFEGSKKVGERCSVLFLAKHGAVTIDALKSFIGAMTGMRAAAKEGDPDYQPGDVWQRAIEKASSGDGTLLAGTELIVTGTTITTKVNKKRICVVSWEGITEVAQAA